MYKSGSNIFDQNEQTKIISLPTEVLSVLSGVEIGTFTSFSLLRLQFK